MEHDAPEGQWGEYRRLVLNELERIDRGMTALSIKIDQGFSERDKGIRDLSVEVGMLKVKCSIYGALTGLASAIGFYLLRGGIPH